MSLCKSHDPVFTRCLCELEEGHDGPHTGLYRERGVPYSHRCTWIDTVTAEVEYTGDPNCPCGCDGNINHCSYASVCPKCKRKFAGNGYANTDQLCNECKGK